MDEEKLITSPVSHYERVHYRSSNEVREIKQMLLSGSKDQVVLAVGKVLSDLNDSKCAVEMITSDISEFLCDAVVPFDSYISTTIYNCLGIMARYEYFFTHNHSSFAMDTVIRALHLLMKNGGEDATVRLPLKILVLIVKGYGQFDVVPEKKPFQNLMNLVFTLLNGNLVSEEVRYHTGDIIKLLLEMEAWKLKCLDNLTEVCEKWFDLMTTKEEIINSLPDEMISLGCALSELTLRYITSNGAPSNEILEECKDDSESEGQENLIRGIVTFLIDIAAPKIQNMPPTSEIKKLEHFFSSLAYLLKELLPPGCQIVQRLSEMGYIQLISVFLSNVYLNRCESMGEVCVVVLNEIILSLSDDIFNFSELWPSGRDNFRKEIEAGMCLLPLDASRWPYILADIEVNRSSRLALIVYFYFYSLTVKSSSSIGVVYPSLVKILNSSVGTNYSPLMVKAMWLTFAMAEMSSDLVPSTSNNLATKKMLDILENQTELSIIYTHHPAVLYWTFSSSSISLAFQTEVVKLWLENRSSDCTVLDDLIKTSAVTRVAVFQLLQNGHEHVAYSAFATLKTFLLHSDDDSLSCSIWFVLPQVLAQYTTDTSTVVKVDYIVELATLRVPEQTDMSKILRIASLLPEALEKSDLLSLTSSTKLALQLLQISFENEDSRVLFSFLRHGSFIQKIVSGITTDFSEIVLINLKIITILWSTKLNSGRLPEPYKQIKMDGNNLLKILDFNDIELIKMGLILIEKMLSTGFECHLLTIERNSSDFMIILFYGLENILIKYQSLISGLVWKCLQHCLACQKTLSEDCLLHEVVKYGLPHLKQTPEMVNFLVLWLDEVKRNGKFYDASRLIKQPLYLETIHALAASLTEEDFDGSWRLSQKVLECCNHFSIDVSCEPFNKLTGRINVSQ